MNIVVLMKQVPDLVEELEVDAGGTLLDRAWLRFITSEYDDHALEQALLLKEQHGGTVRVFALDMGEADEMLFTALAKGADSAVKLSGDFATGIDSHSIAGIYRHALEGASFDLILTGVQAIDDLDGPAGAMLATHLGLPYIGVVSGIDVDTANGEAHVRKEYPGGLLAEFTVDLPAVIGIQAAMQPPRYVPISRIRQTTKTAHIDETAAQGERIVGAISVERMYKPERAGSATMLEGSVDSIAERLLDILTEHGIGR